MESQNPEPKTHVVPDVGLTVIINEKEYTISEKKGEDWVLYRERIDGSSETMKLTARELEEYLP